MSRANVVSQLRCKAESCLTLGSGIYGEVLRRAADDAESGGPVWVALGEHAADSRDSALALRFASSVHRLMLEGHAPELARHYPSAGGNPGPGLWEAFRATVADHPERLRTLVGEPLQTNEVGRSAALLPGFLALADATGLPLRVLELGASAGLNLRFDHYRYEVGERAWGPPGSPVRLTGMFEGEQPELGAGLAVVSRRGCDARPLDPCSKETRTRLAASIWPEQLHRLRLLEASLGLARRVPAPVDEARAPDWLAAQLSERSEGEATVVFHSILWQYLSAPERERLRSVLSAGARRATSTAPLAWLRMEPPGGSPRCG